MSPDVRVRVRALFEESQEIPFERTALFIQELRQHYVEAERAAERNLTKLLLCWLLSVAIGAGFVEETEIAAFRISRVQSLLLFAPLLIGYFSYAFSHTATTAIEMGHALSQAWIEVLPKIGTLKLDLLLGPPTLLRIERHKRIPKSSWFLRWVHTAWLTVLVAGLIIGSLGIVIHVASIMWNATEWPRGVKIGGSLAGIVVLTCPAFFGPVEA